VANQFVVSSPNVPGSLADLAERLAEAGVDLRAIGEAASATAAT
jgi:hypothetical protein